MANLIHGAANSPGPYGSQIGWVDFGEVPVLAIGQSYTLVSTAPGVGKLTMTLTNNGPITATQNSPSQKLGLGYYGVGGNVSFGTTAQGDVNTVKITISNISLVDLNGSPIPSFKLITMDAETTVSGEYWQMVTNGTPWFYEGIVPIGSTMGDPTITGLNTTTYKQTGHAGGNTSPIVSTNSPTQLIFSTQDNFTQLFNLGLYLPQAVTLTKNVDKTYAQPGDIITYTLVATNPTYINLTGVSIIDTIPNGTTFVNNSININGSPSNQTLGTVISIPDLGQGAKTTVTFKVTINNDISINTIPNSAALIYSGGGAVSSIVNTYVYEAKVGAVKSADIKIAKPGTTITYTIVTKNTGNTAAKFVTLIDTIPDGTTFIPNSVTINGAGVQNISPAPPTGINLDTINPNETKTVTFQVSVTSVPPSNQVVNGAIGNYAYTVNPTQPNVQKTFITNLVTIPIRFVNLKVITKGVDKAYADLGDTLIYTIIIPNTGNIDATNVILSDTIAQELQFINNSIQVNGVATAGIPSNVNIGTVAARSVTTVTFKVLVISL